MKKKLIVTIVALIIATLLGLTSDTVQPVVEKFYCQILPEECNEAKSNVQKLIPQSIQKESRGTETK